MNRVFVDTWAWYALVDETTQDHSIARSANAQLLDEPCIFVTTNYVLDETITLIRYHVHHAAAVRSHRHRVVLYGSCLPVRV